jgi:hypothetical protein
LASDDAVGDGAGLKEVRGEGAVETAVDGTVEDLLDNVVDDVVEKVVPGEAEEKILGYNVSAELIKNKYHRERKRSRER